MWFNIDWDLLVKNNLPSYKRKPAFINYARVLVQPLATLHYTWRQWRAANIYKMQHTGQVCYLRKSLNDTFDPSLRRIYIGEGNDFNTTYLYTEAENQDRYLGTLHLRTVAETDTDLDFIVYVPQELYNTQIYALKAQINFYRQGGRRYEIFIINE